MKKGSQWLPFIFGAVDLLNDLLNKSFVLPHETH